MLIILTRHFVQNISTYNYSTIPYCTVFQDSLQLANLQGLSLGLCRVHTHRVPNRVPYVAVRYNIVPVQVYNCTVPYRTVPPQYCTVPYRTDSGTGSGTVSYRTVSYGKEFVPLVIVRYGTSTVLKSFTTISWELASGRNATQSNFDFDWKANIVSKKTE